MEVNPPNLCRAYSIFYNVGRLKPSTQKILLPLKHKMLPDCAEAHSCGRGFPKRGLSWRVLPGPISLQPQDELIFIKKGGGRLP